MFGRQSLIALLLTCAWLAAGGLADRPRDPGRAVAGLAAAGGTVSSLPGFATFGWVSPPLSVSSPERYAELAAAGLNVTVLAWEDSGRVADNLARLDYCRPLGVRCLLFDRRLERIDPNAPATFVWAESVAASYRDDPAFLGYYLGDEPFPDRFGLIDTLATLLRGWDPAHPAWNNLVGRRWFPTREAWLEYTREYVARIRPSVLSNDEYDFLRTGDDIHFVENVAGLAGVARESGLPFWGIVLLIEHGPYRHVSPGELRWQIGQWLSWGARGVGLFTYWTPPPDPAWNWQPAMITWEGARTATYDSVAALMPRVRAIGDTLATRVWLATEHAGSVPHGATPFAPGPLLAAVEGRSALGVFVDAAGAPNLLVVNSDSLDARTITLRFATARRVDALGDDRQWRSQGGGGERSVLDVSLAPGDFTLLRLSGTLDAVPAGHDGPTLAAAPNPARDAVTFRVVVAGAATFEILDLAGRREWSTRFGANGTTTWRGERERGGVVPPGSYLARLEDARGVAVRRVVWLGAAR